LHVDAGHAFVFRIYAVKEKCRRIHAYGRMEKQGYISLSLRLLSLFLLYSQWLDAYSKTYPRSFYGWCASFLFLQNS
jgi:hypothetical protein